MAKSFSFKKKPIGLLDMLAFKKLLPDRQARIDAAPATPIATPYVNQLAAALHPAHQALRIAEIEELCADIRKFRLESAEGELAYFRAGQYLSFKLDIDGATLTRPYSISSAPADAKAGFYEICVKNTGAFASKWIFENWKQGDTLDASGPEGHFYFDSARDSADIIAISGGIGITPLRSMAREIAASTDGRSMKLFYCCNTKAEMLFADEFTELAKSGRFEAIYVVANEDVPGAERGFMTRAILDKYAPSAGSTLFVCGPQGLYRHLDRELAPLNLTPKQLRRELFGEIRDVTACEGYPSGKESETHTVTVRMGFEEYTVPARGDESVLIALERAGLRPPSRCRSGECGYCRSRLIEGAVFVPPEEEMRRQADRLTSQIHPCCSFPLSDLKLDVPRSK